MRKWLFAMLLIGTAQAQKPLSPEKFEVLSDRVADGDFREVPSFAWGQDPFVRVPGFVTVVPEKEDLKLQAVLHSSRDPAAVINGETLSKGDPIERRFVRKIGKNFVLLEENDSLIELALPPATEIKATLDMKEHGGN